MPWKSAGSNADYWRDDNPLIRLWLRFGDDLPVSNFQGATPEDNFSGLMKDSSMMRAHLMRRGAAFATAIGTPVSGLAPWSVSGISFNGSAWVDTSHAGVIGFHHIAPGTAAEQSTNPFVADFNSGSRGSFSVGSETQHSGFCVMGWAKVQYPTSTPQAFRPIIGNYEIGTATTEVQARGGTAGQWQIYYCPSDDSGQNNILRFVYSANAVIATGSQGASPFFNLSTRKAYVDNTSHPMPVPVNQAFFFAFTFHRELHPLTQQPAPVQDFNIAGSGLLKMYLGTTVSGLTLVKQQMVSGVDLRTQAMINGQNCFAIANRAENITQAVNSFSYPKNSVLDEVVVVLDGYMTKDRIEHYMNSGIITNHQNNPTRPEFIPVQPTTEGLRCYVTFDADNGINSAPATSGQVNFFIGNADTFVPGIRGGRALRTVTDFFFGNTLTSPNEYTRMPIGSGRNILFPDINRSRGMTWIGWARPETTGVNIYPPTLGFASTTTINSHTMFSFGDAVGGTQTTDSPAGGSYVYHGYGFQYRPSGITVNRSVDYVQTRGGNNIGPRRNNWNLWAIVWDFDNGLIYHVKDAKHVIVDTQILSPASGLSDENLIAGAGGSLTGSHFIFANSSIIDAGGAAFDDWAFFDRILTLPEMSGFALSGISTPVITAPIDTSFKQTLGYWVFETSNIQVYDPTGVSGTRVNDQSWYRHHLTNISGGFAVDPMALNTRVSSNSLRLDVSGSMLSVERIFTGANLDFSSELVMPPSGFTAGAWLYIPSGAGFAGISGDHHIMGSWGTDLSNEAWQLGITDNKLFVSTHINGFPADRVVATEEIPFNRAFFAGTVIKPSGVNSTAELYMHDGDFTMVNLLRLVGRSTTFKFISLLVPGSESGFSLFNVANRQQGFHSGCLFQGPFVYAGGQSAGEIAMTCAAGISNTVLASGGVSVTDPANISHWKFDDFGTSVRDFGKEQNILLPINQDGHTIGLERAIHTSGVVIRQPEYYDTMPSNADSRRLDLGSGIQSWTFLTWLLMPTSPTNTDQHVIMAKSASTSGIQVFTPADSFQLSANASGALTLGENGDLAPAAWSHIAIVFDRHNNEFTTVINGRYAGASFQPLGEVLVNNSGMAIGGRGDQLFNAVAGGSAFSGIMDDTMIFARALTLPEISGLAANSYNFNEGTTQVGPVGVGAYISGMPQFLISGLIASYMHGMAQDIGMHAGYVSGVSGVLGEFGGWIHGKSSVSGLFGGYTYGQGQISGLFGHFIHGFNIVSGLFGHYTMGAGQKEDELDITLNFQIVTSKDFDARLAVEKTRIYDFDAKLGVIRITRPPDCALQIPLLGTVVSGIPYILNVQGSGIAYDDKKISNVRFTFADFKGAEKGQLISGVPNSGLYGASRVLDTSGYYMIKMEVVDSYGYRSTCVRPFMLIPSGSTSGQFFTTAPSISISGTPMTGSAIHRVAFTHSTSLLTISGVQEYTDFSDQQEPLVNSMEVPSGNVRIHDFTMPGKYAPVWAVSGNWGIISDSLSVGVDYL